MMLAPSVGGKPTRAQVLRDKVVIRLATNEAGPLIAGVLKSNGIDFGADWSEVSPHWLIATVEDDVIGCVQMVPGRPVGFLEMLFVKKNVAFKLRAIAVRKLLIQGFATLYHGGSQYVGGVVATSNDKFMNVLENLNFRKTSDAVIYLKRLA